MSEETLVDHCSPTLAGLKTGNLFSCTFPDQREMARDVRRFNKILAPKGLCMIPLKFENGRALMYLYRPERLARDLACEDAAEILKKAGYEGGSIEEQLRVLIRRLGHNTDFPHEIGLFLSYPPEDVRGFIEQGPDKYKYLGFWKVYGDEVSAKKTFVKFRKCHDVYEKQLKAGMPLAKLAVRV